jgi:hypothetical protein
MREGSEIAEYGEFSVEYRDASHRYWLLEKDGPRTAVPSVTGVLKVLDKPALVGWAERVGIESAVTLMRSGAVGDGVAVSDVPAMVRSYGLGADAQKKAGGDRGTAIHDALRIYCAQGDVPNVLDFEEPVRPYVQGLCRWLLQAAPKPVMVEAIVGSLEHGFAGRFDLLADIAGRRMLVDLKTSKSVYPEMHLQLAAYMLAVEECGVQRPDGALVLAVDADGGFRTAECCARDEDFLAALSCHRAIKELKTAIRNAEA